MFSPQSNDRPRGTKPRLRLVGIIFLAAAVLVVTSTVFVYRMGLIGIHAQETMAKQLLVLQQLDEFLSLLKDAETGQRGYLLTGDEPYLLPYTNVRSVVRTNLDSLQRLAVSGELPAAKVEHVAALTEQKLSELEQTVQARQDKGLDAALAIVRGNQGKQVMDEIRTEVGQMRDGEDKEFAAASRRADWAIALRTQTFIGSCVLNLAFLGWAFRRLSNEARRRESAAHETDQQKQLLATTLASIGDAVIATDEKGDVRFLNAEAERLTGWNKAEAAGKPLPSVFKIINEASRQPVENPVEKVLRQGGTVGLANHTLLIAKNGIETPIDDSAAPIRQADGPLSGVVLVFRDVTAQRKAQEANARLAAIVEFSGDAIIAKNLHGIIQSWNSGAERLFGYRADEVIGKPVTLLFPPDRLKEEDHILASLRQGQAVAHLETIRLAKGGRRIPVAVSVSPLKDDEGNIIGASKVIHDITELTAAREALTREKELLALELADTQQLQALSTQLVHEDNPDILYGQVVDAAIAIMQSDMGSMQMFYPDRGELRLLASKGFAPESTAFWQSVRPNSSTTFSAALSTRQRIIAQDVETCDFMAGTPDLDASRKSGIRAVQSTPLVSRSGLAVGMLSTHWRQPHQPSERELRSFDVLARQAADLIERSRAQIELHQAHRLLSDKAIHLESLVAERTAKLQEMISELQHVSYAIVHDMRAPLRAMNAFAQAVFEDISSNQGFSPELLDYCRRIIIASARLDKLIQDSLSYTKAVLQEVPLQHVDLSRLVPGLIETYPNLQSDKADITIQDPLPVVMGEESLLTQCFSNLLGNAVKFVHPGARPKIRIRTEIFDGTARITVEDNGIGISTQGQSRLFRMFQRLTAEYEGTGIGLAIVRKVVERMGGKVGVNSAPGSGSSFWVELRTAAPSPKDANNSAASFIAKLPASPLSG